uniref:Protein farnesyltransferase/geranylgeranyltransferase type-1 subunit alpha n=1 Tax=Lygus hesperus TaxID=30085 RepID=A0A0A9Z7A1_LYGHE
MSETSSEGSDGDRWVFYCDRPDWKDVTPVKQEEGPSPVVSIAYNAKFKDVYDYMRAVLKSNEISERAFHLTKDALELNPANYTVWQYRRLLLKELKKDLREEFQYVSQLIDEYPKNYQIWHHRMVMVEWMNDPSMELEFLKEVLYNDPKNYHAWKHRQWVIKTFNLFDNELEYTESLIRDDLRNNSAWNQRYFVILHTGKLSDPDQIRKEISFALKAILKTTLNESAWNYMRGLLIHMEEGVLESEVVEFCEKLYASGNKSPHLLGMLIDMAIEGDDPKQHERALQLCSELANRYDHVRAKYWNYMGTIVKEKMNSLKVTDQTATNTNEVACDAKDS